MAGGVTVGFMPVLGTGTITRGVSGQTADATQSPLGLFDALLQMAAREYLGAQEAPPVPAATTELVSVLDQATGATPEPTVSAPMIDTETEAARELLASLLETLSALEQATANGTPLEPALEHKVEQELDALAAMLDIELPETPSIDPLITAAASIETNTLDPLVAIETADPAAPSPVEGEAAASPPASASTVPVLPVAASLPADPTLAAVAMTSLAKGETADPGRDPAALPPVVKDMAEKFTNLAAAIEPRAPRAAEKLRAIAEKLGSTGVDAATLAQLGLKIDPEPPDGEIEAAIARLLHPATAAKPAPAPAPFIITTLAIPDPIIMAPKARPAAPEPARTAEPAAAPPRRAPEAEIEHQVKPEVRSTERTERPADPAPQRSSFTPAPHSAAADNAGPPAQPANATVLPPTAAPAAETKAMHAAYSAPVRQINIPQVAFEIVRQVSAGASRFQIRLDPPELGRIDVKLDVDAAGNVNARMTVERAETLDLMQRDQRALERALAQAGLDSNKTNLEFSLRQNPFAHQEQGRGDGNGRSPYAPFGGAAEADEAVPAPHVIAYRGSATAGGVNMFV